MASTGRTSGTAWLPVAIAAAAVVVGVVFRFLHVAGTPLWLDEAYSAFAADHRFGFIWSMVPRYETHPPLYYSILRLWSLLTGHGLLARRMLGLICGLAVLAIVGVAAGRLGRLTRMAAGERAWLVGAAVTLVALQPLAIQMSRQVRPYPVMMLVYALSLLPLLALRRDVLLRRPLRGAAIAGFFLCEAFMLWLHSLGALYGLTMTLALAVVVLRPGMARRVWAWLAAGQAAAGLAYLPAFLIMLHQARTWVKTGWVVFDPHDVPITVAQIWIDWNWIAFGVALLVAAIGSVLLLRRIGGGRLLTALLLMAVLPVALSVLLSATVSPVFLARTLSPTAIPALLLVAMGLAWPGRWNCAALLPFLIIAGSMAAIGRERAEQGPPQDWYGALAWLTPRMAPGDIVWAYPNEGALPLAYALHDQRRWLPLSQVPAPMPALASGGFPSTGSMGAVSLYPQQIERLMRADAARHPPTIWLLRLSGQLYDKDDAMLHALERTRVPVGRFQSRQIDLIGLRLKASPPVAAAQQAQP